MDLQKEKYVLLYKLGAVGEVGRLNNKIWLILIGVEVIILFAMILADFGVLHTASAPLSPRSIILHITTVVIIFACLDAYKKSK